MDTKLPTPFYTVFAQYGCGAYSASTYNACETGTGTGTNTGTGTPTTTGTGTTTQTGAAATPATPNALAHTGQMIVPGLIVGSLCIMASLYILFGKKFKSFRSK